MPRVDFAYAPAADPAGLPLAISIFADRAHVRDQLCDDAAAAGLALSECGELALLLDGEPQILGEIVFVDCPRAGAAVLAALARIDLRAANSGAHLILSTSVAALDDVFACCDQSAPQILVDAGRAERVLAIGRATAGAPGLRLRELADTDRMTLLRLTEQVGRIAERLDSLGSGPPGIRGDDRGWRLESPAPAFAAAEREGRIRRAARPALPDPRLVRRIIRQRQLRARFFDGELFADPAWNILLDLAAARAEHVRVSVTSLCIASGVPPTTALRWIGQMTHAGLLERVEDDSDRRRAFMALTDSAADAMARYFMELGEGGPI